MANARKILRRILWITPLLIAALVIGLAVYNFFAMNRDRNYHSALTKSIQVTSKDFQHRQEMPVDFSCRGAGTSPHIAWSGAPETTRSYALVSTDFDAPAPYLRLFPITHWVVYNIPGDVQEIGRAAGPAEFQARNILVGDNIAGDPAFAPPCPPLGQHQYFFRIYALDLDQILPASNTRSGVMAAIDGHVLAYGELIGLSSAP
jgi:Raf kinase inhibitor-like YbhB/YbcL family protein